MKKFYDVLCAALFAAVCLSTLTFPEIVAPLVQEALKLCGSTLIPALFPFMVITQLLTRSGIAERAGKCFAFLLRPLLGIRKEVCGAFLTGLAGGFPNGAAAAGILYRSGKCTKADAERTAALADNCSPVFLLSIAGGYALGSLKAGLLLCLAGIITVFLNSLALRICYPLSAQVTCNLPSFGAHCEKKSILCESVKRACENMLFACGYIVVFYTLSGVVCRYLQGRADVCFAIKSLFEVSGAVLSCNRILFPANVVLCAAAAGFSGLSVICQVTDVCHRYGLSVRPFLLSRIVGAVCMPISAAGLLLTLPRRTVSVFSANPGTVPYTPQGLVGITLVYAGALGSVMLCLGGIYAFGTLIGKNHENTQKNTGKSL